MPEPEQIPPPERRLWARAGLGGALMGLANLVPGISGGTMLLASGVYSRFVNAVAEVTTLRFRRSSLVLLGIVAAGALTAILFGAGPIRRLVVDHRWLMYSLFVGLTLGGVPLLWRMIRPARETVFVGAALGLALMVSLARFKQDAAGDSAGFVVLVLSGVAASAAMILPGVSGSYLLLVLGSYVSILGAIDGLKEALGGGGGMGEALSVVGPVALGAAVGLVGMSNLLKWLLRRYRPPTLGFLLGLLVGAVIGIWPFQRGVRPEVGDWVRGQRMTEELIRELPVHRWPLDTYTPTILEVCVALGLMAVGFAATTLIGRFGGDEDAGPGAPDLDAAGSDERFADPA